MLQRLLPTAGAASRTVSVFGRSWTCPLGTTIDVPVGDALPLLANGFVMPQTPIGAGPTSARPTAMPDGTAITAGLTWHDTTLSLLVVYDGQTWRHPSTGAAV